MAANFMADHPARSSRPDQAKDGHAHSFSLHKFWLYETRSKFYLIGRDKKKTLWKVLKINRTEPCELNILEDASSYSESECQDFLNRINEGNKPTGGLRFVTSCYGIVGFVKFFGPYYMLLITKRKQIGAICGHAVYAITKSEIFSLGNSSVSPDVVNCRYESRYKKLFCSVDLTKDFFFSYSYHVMHSLQSNFCDRQNGEAMHGSMFVWNEFLTRGIRNHLKNTLWTVALVYGFFKQAKLSVSGKDFHLTLIARRSRHYAGTRYLKRGVNDKGKVANDVETEQIVFEDECRCGCPIQMSSVVQNRGSIPLFWSQETSRLNLKPDIILHRKDRNYEATRLHFENLVKRYGNPIIILNLIKTNEKRPRESILRAEFANAIDFINRDSSDEASLKFLHWDLHKHFRKKTTNVLGFLGRVAACALTSTGYFYCQVSPSSTTENTPDWPFLVNDDGEDSSYVCLNHNGADDVTTSGCGALEDCSSLNKDSSKFPKFQRGVLRTNCIDCLDRTNVAQYTYGLAALGHQLHELGLIDTPQIDLDTPLADTLMSFYETMGDTLALQYGGSAAHNKIFSQRRGQWKVTIQSQEFFRTLQRYYSNAYMDAEKQDAINVFLGYLRPLHGRSSLWDLDSDHHWNLERCNHGFSDAKLWSVLERSISDGNIHCESCIVESSAAINGEKQLTESVQPARMSEGSAMGLSVSTPEISTCDSDTSYSRCTPSEVCRREFRDGESLSLIGHSVDPSTFSNFLDLEWLSTSESSAEEISTRSSAEDGVPGGAACGGSTTTETTSAVMENGSILTGSPERAPQEGDGAQILDKLQEFSDSFAHWVAYGGILSRCV